jgi:VWFA-related protein
MNGYARRTILVWTLALSVSPVAQQQPVPDAPSATKPANPFPAGTKPAPIEQPNRPEPTPETAPPPQEDQTAPSASPQAGPPKAVHDPSAEDSGRDELPRFTSTTNFVTVPVTVLDNDGRAVLGLMKRDFAIFEDEKQMDLKFFTSDPFPLSAAVIVDQGMADVSLRKVNASLDALAGAFAPYDEVALYTYSNTVQARADWQAAGDPFTMAVKKSKSSGRTGGVPVVSGPLAGGPPSINGQRVDPGYPRVNTPVRESHVLNDAIVRAANDLAKRDKSRRRMIFIISDGGEDGSSSSYQDTLRLLLTNNIAIFALGVDSAAVPVYEKLARIRIPRFGTGNILPKYVSATGGQLITEFSRDAIERAYAELTGQARNQYTLGYTTNVTPSSIYRSIEVRVRRPNVRVYAKDGYYPLPSRR